ncbi:MAG TPA: aminotransferase class I/II-fold pyridoxal phosphate-dependent enzyme [Micropepsaceae bacterium]|nr:aminotransferase class I/II-fold pyridoxal phosphate-dependent enzyme [Micropepsaceae bacterium]
MVSSRLALAPPSSFQRLAQLLEGAEPQSFAIGNAPVALTVGEPQDIPPAFIAEIIHANARDFGRYPPIAGTPKFRAAAAAWLARRFHLPAGAVDAGKQILPLNGSREGLFFAIPPLTPETKGGGRPVVLIPNPFYVTYPAAVLAAGAEPYYVPSRARTRFLPDFASVPKSVLERTVAAFFCSPSNPEGACATAADWRALFELADRYDFTVLADECYCEIYEGDAPAGAAEVRYATTGGFERLLAFHSLSKRSSAPGLRSGFVFGPAGLIADLTRFRNTSAPQVPLPVLEASAAAWSDEAHVEQARARYRERFAIARRLLGNKKGFRVPPGSFYLWLDVGDGAAFAKALWRKCGVRVMPGAFMGVEEIPGDPRSNPGYPYIRVALVHDSAIIEAALERIADLLEEVG